VEQIEQSRTAGSGVGDSATAPARVGRRLAWTLAVAATVVALVAGGTWLAAMSGETESPDSSCAAEIVFDGRTYAGYGDPLRVPRRGEPLGVATTPACADGQYAGGEELEVWTVPGVEPHVALMADGVVWIEGRESALPEQLQELTEPVGCTAAGESTVTGRLVGVEAPIGEEEFEPRPPYLATLVADEGASLPLARYSSVTIEVQVTATTDGGDDAELVAAALRDGAHLDIAVVCTAGRFRATSWRLAE